MLLLLQAGYTAYLVQHKNFFSFECIWETNMPESKPLINYDTLGHPPIIAIFMMT